VIRYLFSVILYSLFSIPYPVTNHFAMTYPAFVARVWQSSTRVADTEAVPLPHELALQALWFDGHLGHEFTTADGRAVRIVQFGEWNRASGPDFLHAAVEIDGTLHHGPLELDLRPSDWEAHGHGANPAFRATVLHVTVRDEASAAFTRTCDHRLVPRVTVPAGVLAAALDLPPRLTAVAKAGRCATPLAGMPERDLLELLDQAALHRARRKAARFLRTAAVHGRDAALFQSLAECLGYAANRLPLLLLAQRVPLGTLRNLPAEPILLGAAGFLAPEIVAAAPVDTRDHLHHLWDSWWKHRTRFESQPDRTLPWTFHGQRPANHPHRRVAALACLADHWPRVRQPALARPFSAAAVLRMLAGFRHPFWNHHHTLSSRAAATPLALIGRSRALEWLANTLVPLALAEDPAFTWDKYLGLRAAAPNDKVKRATLRLFGQRPDTSRFLKSLAHHQALLQIYHDFCLADTSSCADCHFPEQLSLFPD